MKLNIFISAFFIFLITGSSVHAKDQTLIYEFLNGKGENKEIELHTVTIQPTKNKELQFTREIKSSDSTLNTKFVLDKNYETINFQAIDSEGGTNYQGILNGRTITVTGEISGKSINEEITLDEKPFYYTPKFNLSRFALSGEKEIQFWMLRKDSLSKYLMQAKHEGEENIIINGEEVPAIKIYYSATGKGERFYKRIYYFRKSDGIFIMKKNSDKSSNPSGKLIKEN